MNQNLFDGILYSFPIKNTWLLMGLLHELMIKHPQINHQTKIQLLQSDYIKMVEMPDIKITPSGLRKKPGIKNKMARIIGEIIPSKNMTGYESVMERDRSTEKTIWCKSFHLSQGPYAMRIRYIYLPEKDTLFVSDVSEHII